jgi:mycothiol synthase
MRTPAQVTHIDRLGPDETTEVLALAHAAGDADGAYPLSEHVVLHIRHGGDAPAVHLLIRLGETIVGYAHVDTTDVVEGASAELTVHPMYRRQGLGRALVMAAIGASPDGRLRLWAHGDHPSASALALRLGFERYRVLWQMRRSLYAPVPAPELPPDVRLRPFRAGVDDEAWVALNAKAFAGHPDQGRWTLADLRVRLKEPWFDPDGFLLAEREGTGELLGFHWTKVHGEVHTHPLPQNAEPHAHEPIGEVYVLGISPDARGMGLGAALTLAGLRHLRTGGLDQAMLYVDESNRKAVALYGKLGFSRWSTDVCFRRSHIETAALADQPPR